jgi:hypothetical protein
LASLPHDNTITWAISVDSRRLGRGSRVRRDSGKEVGFFEKKFTNLIFEVVVFVLADLRFVDC